MYELNYSIFLPQLYFDLIFFVFELINMAIEDRHVDLNRNLTSVEIYVNA